MAQVVSYDVLLRVKEAVAAAVQLVRSFGTVQESATKMGAGVNKAEGAMSRLAKVFTTAAAEARAAAHATANVGHQAEKTAAQISAATHRMQANQARSLHAAHQVMSGRMPSGHTMVGLGGTGVALMGGYMGAHVVGHALEEANKLRAGGLHLGLMGATPEERVEAQQVIRDLSAKYRNLSRAEVQHGLMEDVSIYGNMQTAIKKADIHARVAWALKNMGGDEKHGHGWEGESLAAVKSAEIFGKFKPEEMEQYMPGLLAMKGLFKSQAKITDYLAAQRLARHYFLNQDERFRFGIFPALVQEYGPNAGVGLRMAGQKILGGVKLSKKEMATMAEYGMAGADGEWSPDFKKQWQTNAFDAAQRLARAIADKNKLHIGSDEEVAAGSASAKDNDEFRKLMAPIMSKLVANPTGAGQLVALMLQKEKFEKDANALLLAGKPIEEMWKSQKVAIDDLNNAYAEMKASWSNFQADFVDPIWAPVKGMIRNMSDIMSGKQSIWSFFKPPAAGAGWGEWGLYLGKMAASLAAINLASKGLRWMFSGGILGRLGGAAAAGFGMAGIGAAIAKVGALTAAVNLAKFALRSLSVIGLGVTIYEYWDTLAAALDNVGVHVRTLKQEFKSLKALIISIATLDFKGVAGFLTGDKNKEGGYDWGLLPKIKEFFLGSPAYGAEGRGRGIGDQVMGNVAERQLVEIMVKTAEGVPITVNVEGRLDATSLQALISGHAQASAPLSATVGTGRALTDSVGHPY